MNLSTALLVLLVLAGCAPAATGPGETANTGESRMPMRPRAGGLDPGTPEVQMHLRAVLERVASGDAQTRIDVANEMARYGEPALYALQEGLSHPSAEVRSFSAWRLGLGSEPRVLDALAARLSDPAESVRLEVATALVRQGDARGLHALIEGLEHPDPQVRLRSIQILGDETGGDNGYRPDDPVAEREAAVARWRAWLAERIRRGA